MGHDKYEEKQRLEFHLMWSYKLYTILRSYSVLSTGASMASSRVSPNLSTVVSSLHLIFTILSVAFLSYKVYYLESELSLIRGEISTGGPSNAGIKSVTQATPLSTVPTSEQFRSGRNRRAGQKKSESSSTDKLKEVCVQKLLNNLRVSRFFLPFLSLRVVTKLQRGPKFIET